MREPGATHKENWESGTSAALAGGFTAVLAMPNTQPPITEAESMQISLAAAAIKAHCDYGQFIGAGTDNIGEVSSLAKNSAGLKMYLDQTYGPLRLDELSTWMAHFERWPRSMPIVAHAEGRTMAAIILLAALHNRSIHIAHISRQDEIAIIRASKEMGIQVTCEVAPHHLFLTQDDINADHPGRSEVRPDLATEMDRQALWDNFDIIDCVATDHAPHTLPEKDGPNPPPGFPGLETALPLMLTAVHEGRLTIDDLVLKMYTNPKKIFNIPDQPETWIEVDMDADYEIKAADNFTRCGWTPFEGWHVRGRVRRVVLRGREAFRDGAVAVPPGFGMNLCQMKT
jgi:carbamoyl-phosphate synthase/aspartate carbamoyltransferase/dihydroorotase